MPIQLRPLTRREEEILALIECRPVPPSIRDLCRDLGLRSTNGVFQHLKSLERKGAIRREPFEARAIRSTRQAVPPAAAALPPDMPRAKLELRGIVSPAGRIDWSNPPTLLPARPRL
jgi:SOS-response transcriptional repressor LexA